MPFCPRCRCEYNIGVAECIDCRVPLVLRRPTHRPLFDFELDELIVPIGAFFCLVGALAMLGLQQMAGSGAIEEPLSTLIAAQPPCMTAFYVFAAVASGLILTIAVIRWVFFRSW